MFVLYCVCTGTLGWHFLPAELHCKSSLVNKLWVSWGWSPPVFMIHVDFKEDASSFSMLALCGVKLQSFRLYCQLYDSGGNLFLCWRATLCMFGHLEHLETLLKLTHSRTLEYQGAFLSYRYELKIFLVECGCQVCVSCSFFLNFFLNCVELVGVLAKPLTFPAYIWLNKINRYCKGTQ